MGRTGWTVFVCVLCVLCGGELFAQFQMPDPKQMSGIPRPVDDLPNGAVSVRLIRGSLSNNLTGHPVDLHVGSKVLTVKTDENGRAEFKDFISGTAGAMVKATAEVDGESLTAEEFGSFFVLLVVAGKAGLGLVERQLREDRDTVEGFLTVDCYVVAQGLEGLAREGLVLGLGFLQAHDVGLPLPQPG